MKIPDDAEIPAGKLVGYLLAPRFADDKSKFLAQAGFTLDNPDGLLVALRTLAAGVEATQDGENEFGTFYRADGPLASADGRPLAVATVWLRWHSDGSFHFVTLKPSRRPRP